MRHLLFIAISIMITHSIAAADPAAPSPPEKISCCEYNDKRIADCQFHMSDHGLTIEWSDGVKESYQLISQGDDGITRTYADKRGGIWKFNLHLQGNVSMTNTKNGNTIFKPLRGCYKD